LGFIGKNSMLIKPGRGSFFFLAEILSNIDVIQERTLPSNGHCGSCHQCQSSCPTEAIVSDRVVDARKCISYLTIEKRGALSYDEREAIGGWLFGCDICQEVCPFNHGPLKSGNKPDLPEFSAQNGVGPFLSLREVLKIRDEKDFLAKFKDTALLRAKREGLLRNACVVARNKKYFNLTSLLEDCVSNDSSEIIRSHALWALSEFARFQEGIKKERLNFLLNKCLNDNSHIVSSEARQLCNGS
jgi:epoxyqueuosine reductase